MSMTRKNVLALIVICLTFTGFRIMNKPAVSTDVSWEDVVSEAVAGRYRLITTDELWETYTTTDTSLLLVDTRQEWEYRTGHIKGAVNFPMEPTWLSRWQNRGALKKFIGPDRQKTIVFY